MPSANLGYAGLFYGLAGRHVEARAILTEIVERIEQENAPDNALALADIYVGLGEYEEAMHWLAAAYEEHDISLVWLKVFWVCGPLRSDPRFQAILGRMDFPEP